MGFEGPTNFFLKRASKSLIQLSLYLSIFMGFDEFRYTPCTSLISCSGISCILRYYPHSIMPYSLQAVESLFEVYETDEDFLTVFYIFASICLIVGTVIMLTACLGWAMFHKCQFSPEMAPHCQILDLPLRFLCGSGSKSNKTVESVVVAIRYNTIQIEFIQRARSHRNVNLRRG